MKLAVIGKVIETCEIDGADLIQQAVVVCGDAGKWSGVVSKDTEIGQLVTVFLQDAVLPPDPRWAFMERHKWRVRMARFKGVPSECVILPTGPEISMDTQIGTDVTEALGVTKYSKPIPDAMNAEVAGDFPNFLPKTDEPNFQTVDFKALMSSTEWYMTEKADGTSCTAWVDEDGLHVASRNLELREFSRAGKSNVYWQCARKYELEKMPISTAVQFEVVGPSIQKNPMGLTVMEARAFAVFKKIDGRWDKVRLSYLPQSIPSARLIKSGGICVYTADQLRFLAEITYPNGKPGEGIVIRAADQSWSFKVINLLYKD